MGQRSRKRGRREKPATDAVGTARNRTAADRTAAKQTAAKQTAAEQTGAKQTGPKAAPASRTERRNAAMRATLRPLSPGERPWAVTISAGLAALSGLGNLIAYVAGAKIGGKHPAAGGIILFSLLMLVCAGGMWQLRYWAVLGFMGLLAIIVTLFALLLVEASNLLGFLIPPVIIGVCGFLFIKLVRVLSRIQMPKYPGR